MPISLVFTKSFKSQVLSEVMRIFAIIISFLFYTLICNLFFIYSPKNIFSRIVLLAIAHSGTVPIMSLAL